MATATGSRTIRRPKASGSTTTKATKSVAKPRAAKPAAASAIKRVSSIPDIEVYNAYIDRKWSGGHTTMELYEKAMANGWNVLNEGPTGCAKTHSVEAFAAKHGLHYYAIPNNATMDVSQIVGQWNPDPTGASIGMWQDGGMTDIFRHGGVILANEFPFLPGGVMAYLYQALGRERQITLMDNGGEIIKAHPNVLIVADMNPGYMGVKQLNAAVRNRFLLQLEWSYDPTVEQQLIRSDSLRAMAEQLRAEAAKGTYDTPIATNMLMEFEKIAVNLSMEFAINNFVTHFEQSERASVKLVCNTWSSNIEAEIVAAYMPPKPEDKKPEQKKKGSTPIVDDEWGIEGVDWVYEDETP